MLYLTLEQTADYLESATIERTINTSWSVIHFGKNAAGVIFVMLNNVNGKTTVSEAP